MTKIRYVEFLNSLTLVQLLIQLHQVITAKC